MSRSDFQWNYYSQDRPRKVEGGIKIRSDRGSIGETWWSRRWVQVLESLGMGTRLTRGRSYARQGQVLSIEVETGLVKAAVQGSMQKPYVITINLQPFSAQNWEKITDAMATQALFAAKLLAGEMPTNIEEAFNSVSLSLFPTAERDLKTSCTCPDWANPCKHTAAVYYVLAERFDEDPFLIFKLRGRTKEAIIAALREKRVEALPATEVTVQSDGNTSASVEPMQSLLPENPATFWLAGEELASFAINPQDASVDKAVLKRLGASPFLIGGENLTELLAKAYDVVEEAALRKAGEGEEG